MTAGTILLGVVSIAYLAATVGLQRNLFGSSSSWPFWRRILWISFAFHTAALVLVSVSLGHAPITRMDEAIASFAWLLVLMYLLLGERWKVEMVGTVAAPAAFAMTAFSAFALSQQPSASVGSAWIWIHVASLLLGYAAFCLAAFCAVLYFLQARMLKKKKLGNAFTVLPPLDTLDRVAYRFILAGFPLMVLGTVTGILLNNWHWVWNSKFVLVGLTGMIYLGYLHARIAGWQGRRVNMVLLVAFVCVLVSFLAPDTSHPF
ncbi:MAG: cytochrome c biogenesis protein CcsA [Armatimonadetes bacterium]|nr:cytochrome c biogenesis protein CcsA [Armatimonadota bacterium]